MRERKIVVLSLIVALTAIIAASGAVWHQQQRINQSGLMVLYLMDSSGQMVGPVYVNMLKKQIIDKSLVQTKILRKDSKGRVDSFRDMTTFRFLKPDNSDSVENEELFRRYFPVDGGKLSVAEGILGEG